MHLLVTGGTGFVMAHVVRQHLRADPAARATVVDIALEVGFQSQAHFSTVFKRLVGDSPSNWRHHALDRLHGA